MTKGERERAGINKASKLRANVDEHRVSVQVQTQFHASERVNHAYCLLYVNFLFNFIQTCTTKQIKLGQLCMSVTLCC